ncbi:hypothetical protein [Dyadobacter luticola]|uniref:GH26 domain-containing protein n=1 Tax=Dyadobacter luticola TaxID=1979387 RepID=A0A5R9KQ30_9BACT|nr:hypothetical protein [Dyadobacter luticola]TLU98214.1 hypothetical protein FEN17_25920 [Dyadobacter luticola]
MRRRAIIVIGILLVAGAAFFLIRKKVGFSGFGGSSVEIPFHEPVLAVYNRFSNSKNLPDTSTEHISILLDKAATAGFFSELGQQLSSKKTVIVTVKLTGPSDGSLLPAVVGGSYDKAFAQLFETFKKHTSAVFVRLNPEMEVPVKTYPWQYQSSQAYADAFRHFAKLCKVAAPNVQLVWSPAGYPGTEEYYPGDEFTDLISITLKSDLEKWLEAYPPYPDLQTEVKRKIHRVRFMPKPVIILGKEALKTDSAKAAIEEGLAQVRREASIIYSTAVFKNINKNPARANTPIVGVYDPKLLLTGSASVNAEHIFIDLAHIQTGSFQKELSAILKRKHVPIISFEPWRDQKVRKDTNVLRNTINGVYDEEFKKLYGILKASGSVVYLRFAHEMEIPIHRYAWQIQDPVLYIKAFRYFMELGGRDEKIKRVWGPAGDRGSMEWWPGEDVVDFVSIAIYGLPDKNITDPKMQESFSTIYERKFHRVGFSGKPIFVTEFGVKGPEDYKQKWIEDAAELIKKHKEIAGISYFNLADNPEAWGDIPAPDWSIQRSTFETFIQKLSAP